MSRPRALISLGTNTTRLLVVRDEEGGVVEQLEHGSIGTRLGEGLRESGALLPAAMERTLAAVERFNARARERGASIACIATSAMRRASNGDAFAAKLKRALGTTPTVLPGAEEAAASFSGATYGAQGGIRFAVLDVGGGSTECAVGRAGMLARAVSYEIGAVRLTERHPGLRGDRPGPAAHEAAWAARADVAQALAPIAEMKPVDEVRAVGGTPLTLAAIEFAVSVEGASGLVLERAAIDGAVSRMLDLDLEQRRALPGAVAQRADILPAGAIVLSEALRLLDAPRVRAEANDLLLGYLLATGPAAAGG